VTGSSRSGARQPHAGSHDTRGRTAKQTRVNLLVLNQKLDASDSGLEVTCEWVRELASRVDNVWVITHEHGAAALPPNVHVLSLGKENRFYRARKIARFYACLHRVLRDGKIDGCFVHMVPLFAAMAAPLLRPRGIPIVQWYTHSATPLALRAAVAAADKIVSASRDSFVLETSKLLVTGHGIDTERFRPGPRGSHGKRFEVLTVGRLSPIKRQDVLIDAVAMFSAEHRDVHLTIIGEPRGQDGARWSEELHRRVARLQLHNVSFTGPVSRSELPAWYDTADVCVNLSESKGLDKVVLEAMSCGVPVITSNSAFAALLADVTPSLVLPDSEPATIAAALLSVMQLDGEAAGDLGRALRAKVREHHDLGTLMDRLVELFRELRHDVAERETRTTVRS
jgi:glycosyltransferase involved in cell wall biosynthesis